MRSSTMPTSAETTNAAGTAASRYQSKSPAHAAEQVLHDIGRIGADHDELAVRHVDDAHQPVGDREAERGEQQDRAERDAGEERCRSALAPREAAFDRAQALLRLARRSSSLVVGRPTTGSSSRVLVLGVAARAASLRIAARRASRSSVLAVRCVAAICSSTALISGSVSFAERLAHERQHRRVGAAGELLRGGQAHVALLGETSFERGQARSPARARRRLLTTMSSLVRRDGWQLLAPVTASDAPCRLRRSGPVCRQ